jgi:hypothetical protein
LELQFSLLISIRNNGNCPSRDFVHPQVDPSRVSRAQRRMRCRPGTVPVCGRSRISGAPLHFVTRCTASGTRDGVGRVRNLSRHALAVPVFSCFSADSESSIPSLTISNSTHSLVPAAHVCARGFASLLHSPRIEGWAERRETFGCVRGTRGARHLASKTRVNALMTRHARRLARRLASHDAGRSPLGAPPWRFWASGPRFRLLGRPAALQRRAVAFRIRRASSSQPGRSAWRAGSRASRGQRLRAAAAGRHSPLRLQDVSGDAPQ